MCGVADSGPRTKTSISGSSPPATAEHARRVAAELLAFCPETAYHVDAADYAHDLEGNQVWLFWWD